MGGEGCRDVCDTVYHRIHFRLRVCYPRCYTGRESKKLPEKPVFAGAWWLKGILEGLPLKLPFFNLYPARASQEFRG
jgi:hypothetical protein